MENKYRAVKIVDCENNDKEYGIILLNNKHDIEDLQNAIYDIKNEFVDKGMYEYTVEDILSHDRLDEFDWMELPTDTDNNIIEV